MKKLLKKQNNKLYCKSKKEIKGKHTEMYGRKARSLRVVIEERKLLE